jgi:hypothetical protein
VYPNDDACACAGEQSDATHANAAKPAKANEFQFAFMVSSLLTIDFPIFSPTFFRVDLFEYPQIDGDRTKKSTSSDGPRPRRSRMMLLDHDEQALAGNIARNQSTLSASQPVQHVPPAAARKYAVTRPAERTSSVGLDPPVATGGWVAAFPEPLLREGYKGLKARAGSIPPASAARIPEAADRLIELYTARNRPEEVEKWRAERARYDKPAGSPLDGNQ